ncbi:MAG: maturation of Asn-linked oligosaccharides protein [Pleopsidium flavum]|nr:MAG: maturation of Asn-linked oligosaccharides protein [Pleopsidium flavum]
MRISSWSLTVGLLILIPGSYALPGPRPSLRSRAGRPENSTLNRDRADAVKAAFTFAWDGYYKYCFGHDELHPVTNTCGDSRNGWGASAVDAFSTALVMQIPDIVNEILHYIPTIDFSKTSEQVSLFETTIRYVAGMLSGYDLLKGPLAKLANDTSNVDTLLTQAKKLADILKYSFDSPTGLPHNGLNIEQMTTDGSTSNGLATIGTLVLEWTHLSDLTGDPEYAQLTQKAESYLLNPQNPDLGEPFPGLLGTNVDINTGNFIDNRGGWSGGDDSFYEYLLKMYVYDSSRFGAYKDRWITAADSTIAHLTSHPSSRPDLTFLAEYTGTTLIFECQHLTCFDGGNFLLGGKVLNRQDYIDFGLALVNGCHDTYISTVTGIGPETFSWNTTTLPADQAAFYATSGFWIENSQYITRPEVVESYYYAYRITGNQKYRDWAWDAFLAINATTRTGSGFSSISNVNAPGGGAKTDNQESFLFAEVLKYSYLIHAPDEVWQVEHNGKNEFVFNTEAHPFKVAGTPV